MVRPCALQGGAVRPAELRSEHSPRVRTDRRPLDQHHRPSGRATSSGCAAHLGIDRWLVWGGSWGSTLGLAYAEAHPERVTEMILVSVVTTTAREVEWVTRAMGRIFPAEWATFRDGVPAERA